MKSVYICDGIRSPFGRFGGGLAKIRPDDLAALTLKTLLARQPQLDPALVDQVVLGCANQAGEDNRNVARMALLLAGMPQEVPGVTVNRLCASGLEAVAQGAREIACGEAELVFAGGVESMTRAPFVMGKAESAFSRAGKIEDTTIGWRFVNPAMQAAYGVDSMTETAENVADQFQIGRQDQDAFACRSQQRAAAAQQAGVFDEELFAVPVPGKAAAFVSKDEHPRPDTTMDILSGLKAVVRPNGTVTAGNAAGINDGAVALILATEEAATKFGLTPRARVTGYATAGVAPRIMGVGPIPAIGKLLDRRKLSISDFDLIELNEAFAAQALAVVRSFGLPDDAAHVNPHGGAIALGHPLGASGARLCLRAMHAISTGEASRALITMCVGVGQGAALALEAV
jgi:3-oxoadipyl-CoA thiolase